MGPAHRGDPCWSLMYYVNFKKILFPVILFVFIEISILTPCPSDKVQYSTYMSVYQTCIIYQVTDYHY